jgi:hypothetical protein
MAVGDTSVGTGATLTFAGFVAEITSISIDGPEATIVDVSHLGSTTLREKLAGDLLEPGTVTAEGHFKSTIDVDGVVGTSGSLAILTGSLNTWTYAAAIMTSFSASIPLEDVETFSATWQINGALVVTP